MSRHTSKVRENRLTHLLLLSFLGFGIVIAIFNWLSIEPSFTNVQFYLILFVVLAFLYKPFGSYCMNKIIVLLKSFAKPFKKMTYSKMYKVDMKRINQLNCVEVAQFLKPILETQGYTTVLKNGSELGADLIIKKGIKTYVVQTKRKSEKVGPGTIHEAIEALNQYAANGAIVITNQYYTSSAKKLAKRKGIKLIDRDELTKMLKTTNKKYRFAAAFSFILNK
ncbi:restriction endonuclease [Ureibacillus manganicus]|uniref:restriction endonuclease n=1 Tax=Ureibacillus manganicus TaxID=1266064 RepID=UPI00068C7CAE|nr:restriction endonuclease [Ureibacillus manganicus]